MAKSYWHGPRFILNIVIALQNHLGTDFGIEQVSDLLGGHLGLLGSLSFRRISDGRVIVEVSIHNFFIFNQFY